ncbi:MAG: phage/plasmid primase, P4 family [archaeon]
MENENSILPRQLQREEFDFVKLRRKDKRPAKPGWKDEIMRYNDSHLIQELRGGGNIGLKTGVGNVFVIDIDDREVSDKTDIDTYGTLTGTKMKHFIFEITDVSPEDLKGTVLKDNNGKKIGDIRGIGMQVLISGCTHPNGQKYESLNDLEIKKVTKAEFDEIVAKISRESAGENEPLPPRQPDNTRSGKEFKEVKKLIEGGKTKEEVFESMKDSEKWKSAHQQYRELTYNKALKLVEGKKRLSKEDKEALKAEAKRKTREAIKKASEGLTDAEVRGEIEYLLEIGKTKAANYFLSIHLRKKYNLLTFEDTQEIFVYKDGVYYPKGDRLLASHAQHILADLGSSHFISETLAHIKRSTYQKREKLLEPKLKICLQNGILNLETMQLEPHTPRVVFFNKLEINFVSSADNPRIKKFLKEVLTNDEEVLTIQELFGYCLYKEYLIHKAFMFVGSGSNGKSTLIKVMKRFLGDENCAAVPLHQIEGDKFAVASLFGKLANMFADLPAKALKDSSLFKMLTGEDNIPAEKKFKDKFFFKNYAKMIFSANQIPKTPDESDAFFRRWIIIQFPNQFTGKSDDKKLTDKLTTDEEMSGLLNYAIEGLKRLLEKGDFSGSKTIEEMRELYMRQSDSVMSFVVDCLEVSTNDHIGKRELYLTYKQYCKNKNYPIVPENSFHRDLQKNVRVQDYKPAIKDPNTNNFIRINCWRGIKLIPNSLDNQDNLDQNQGSSPGSPSSPGNSSNNSLGAWINDEEPEFETEDLT